MLQAHSAAHGTSATLHSGCACVRASALVLGAALRPARLQLAHHRRAAAAAACTCASLLRGSCQPLCAPPCARRQARLPPQASAYDWSAWSLAASIPTASLCSCAATSIGSAGYGTARPRTRKYFSTSQLCRVRSSVRLDGVRPSTFRPCTPAPGTARPQTRRSLRGWRRCRAGPARARGGKGV